MRIDAHQHFWTYSAAEYPWIGPDMQTLARDRMPADLEPLLRRVGMDATIAVQARQSLEETKALLDIAAKYPFVRGVVGWVDLCSPSVEEQLERFARFPALRGVRHVVQDEPDDRFLLREDFMRGIGTLKKFGLVYDLLIYPRQLPAAVELVARYPEQVFVLDHIAKPPIRSGAMEPWRSDIRKLAAMENVSCKLSGMVTEADWNAWKPEHFAPYMDVVMEAFGPQRLMVGSDWPVCTLAASYEEVIGLVEQYSSGLSTAERSDLWGGTAARTYGV